jgi:hemoglobin
MMEREIYVPPEGPPQGPPPSREIYSSLGEKKLRELVHSHYNHLKNSTIRDMFPENMDESADKSADFLIQVLGGPPIYSQKYGPPRMRMRHFPFEIDEKARRVWLSCYKQALDDTQIPEKERSEIWKFLVDFSSWMVNTKSNS